MIALLESRLDTVVYRAKLAPTVFAARQLINHGHIRVNKKRVNVSSYLLKDTDQVEVNDKSKKLNIIDGSIQSKERFQEVQALLLDLDIPFVVNPLLVRGLDYYCLTVFEITSENLGAQNAVCGGGRYDKLIEELGGPETPAIGFAIGIERLLQLVSESTIEESSHSKNPEIYIISLGKEPMSLSFQISNQLRESGIRTELSFDGGSMKSQMKKANRSSARFTLIIGEDELLSNSATLKNMSDSSQEEINLKEIKHVIKEKIQN